MVLPQSKYVGLRTDEDDPNSTRNDDRPSETSIPRNMSFPKTAYVGVALDDVDILDIDTRSIQTSNTQTSRFTQSSQASYRSNLALFATRAQLHASQAASSIGAGAKRLFTVEYWRTAPHRTKSFWIEAWTDAKSLGIRHHLWRVANILLPIAAIITVTVSIKLSTSESLYPVYEACRPDSGFYVGSEDYSIWTSEGFFQITLGFGEFSFSTAKIIDVAWDILVGRGVQGILIWICFAVYGKALVRSMESSTVSFGTFEAMTFQCGSVTGSLKLARDIFKHPTTQAKFMVFWVITSACFVLAFPTMVGAMSGYAANINAYVAAKDGTMHRYSTFSLVRYIIHDGDRLGDDFSKEYKVLAGVPDDTYQVVNLLNSDDCISPYYPVNGTDGMLDWSLTDKAPACAFYWHVSEYTFNYGFLGLNKTESTFNNSGKLIDLPSPALNITALFWDEYWLEYEPRSDWHYYPYGYTWKTPTGDQPFMNFAVPLISNGDLTFTADEVNDLGQCQQSNTSYKWGFSFIILFIVLVLFLVWCLGMYLLWLDAFLHSRVDNAGRHMGLQRAVLDLAKVLRHETEDVPEMAANKTLCQKVRNDLKGGKITYKMLDPEYLPLSRWSQLMLQLRTTRDMKQSLFLKAKADWQWVVFFLACVGLLASAIGGSHAPVFTSFILCYGSGCALYAGPQHKGRWMVFLVCAVIAIGLGPVGPFVYQDKGHYGITWLQQDPWYALWWWYG